MSRVVALRIQDLRGGYVNRRNFFRSLRNRVTPGRKEATTLPGYRPAEVELQTSRGLMSFPIRDYDVPFLRRSHRPEALEYLQLILDAKAGDRKAQRALDRRLALALSHLSRRFSSLSLVESEYVLPSTTDNHPPEELISNKGATLLRLIQDGYPIPDFTFLTSRAYQLSEAERAAKLEDALSNMQRLTGQDFGGQTDPLLLAMRCAMPSYIPGVMPTYLNVGATEDNFPALVKRYGREAALKILLNNLKMLLQVLDPAGYEPYARIVRPDLDPASNQRLSDRLLAEIRQREPALLSDPFYQAQFLLRRAYSDFEANLDLLRNFMRGREHFPVIILQKMVCSALDNSSYAGVLYSRHPCNGLGSRLQFARGVFGEEIMTGGTIIPDEQDFSSEAEVRQNHPAVAHFYPALSRLEASFAGPVTIEFAAENGLFAMLQLNHSELSGSGTLIAVMDLYRKGTITSQRVRELIKPYHIRQLESPAIDRRSLAELESFAQGISVLPRTAVSGRLYFSAAAAAQAKARGENVILARPAFLPADTVTMSKVDGIVSLTPAAIHVVTTAQNLGVPALLNLESQGVTIDQEAGSLQRPDGRIISEGDWVTISSRFSSLFAGQARFSEARLLRFMAGKRTTLLPLERPFFQRLVADYAEYQALARSAELAEIATLRELAKLVDIDLRPDRPKGDQLVNDWFDHDPARFLDELFKSGLGDHLRTGRVFDRLTVERQEGLLRAAAKRGLAEARFGAEAGSFILGRILVKPRSVAFWNSLTPAEAAYLVNEWVRNEEYCAALSFAGERKVRKAMEYLRSDKFTGFTLRPVTVQHLLSLKLSQQDLSVVAAAIPAEASRQTLEVFALLFRNWGGLIDYDKPWDFSKLKELCQQAGLPIPDSNSL